MSILCVKTGSIYEVNATANDVSLFEPGKSSSLRLKPTAFRVRALDALFEEETIRAEPIRRLINAERILRLRFLLLCRFAGREADHSHLLVTHRRNTSLEVEALLVDMHGQGA